MPIYQKPLNILEILHEIELFSNLPLLTRETLAKSLSILEVRPKEYIFHEGEIGNCGFYVLDGRVALSKSSPSGKELIVELITPIEPFGIIALVGARAYPLSAKAIVPSILLSVPKSAVLELAKTFPQIYQHFTEIIGKRLRNSHNLSRALAHDRVEVRAASALIALAGQIEQEKLPLEIRIRRQELADLTGMTIETATRVMKSMEKDGLVDLSRQGVIKLLNIVPLRSLLDQ